MNNPARNGREIERKFLVKELPPGLNRFRSYPIAQGYLASEPGGRHVRLRKKGRTASLTFKVGRGGTREEREIKLSAKQFAALWPATVGRRLGEMLASSSRKWNSQLMPPPANSNHRGGLAEK